MDKLTWAAALSRNEDRKALESSEVFRNFVNIMPQVEKFAEELNKKVEMPNPVKKNEDYTGESFQDKIEERTQAKKAEDEIVEDEVIKESELDDSGYYINVYGKSIFISPLDTPDMIVNKVARTIENDPELKIKAIEESLGLNKNVFYNK